MINISRVLFPDKCSFPGDSLRYAPRREFRFPVVVWHLTGRCNLSCRHCYAEAAGGSGEFPLESGREFLRLLSENYVPALLFSGGEPMCCENFFRYLEEANLLGMKVTVSTNGSLIDGAAARLMAPLVSYVGISIDGPREAHDEFRGKPGSFDAAVGAAELLASLGCRVGLRFTLARPLIPFLDDIFSLAESLPVSRICFYHFMPAGRGERDAALAPARGETDAAIWRVMEWADRVCASRPIEILTVGDASDGARLHEYLRRHGASRLERASSLLRSAASRTGVSGILSVRWDGVVFRNQFSWNRPLGNWREIGRIAREKPPLDETAPECAPCHWRARHICASRAAGFGRECGAFRRKGAGR